MGLGSGSGVRVRVRVSTIPAEVSPKKRDITSLTSGLGSSLYSSFFSTMPISPSSARTSASGSEMVRVTSLYSGSSTNCRKVRVRVRVRVGVRVRVWG